MDSKDRIRHEEMLRRSVLEGNESAWRTWYDATFDELYGYILWRTGGCRDVAEEIVQETWLTAVRHIRRFDPRRGSFAAWMRGLAMNVIRHHFRRRRRLLAREQKAGVNGSTAQRPEALEQAERILATLDALSQRQEEVLRAKYLEGLSVGEIAEKWSETPKAVESLLFRARQSFRDIYDE
jgi:RNA polymerase sigma-70 factor, ECF subfamily